MEICNTVAYYLIGVCIVVEDLKGHYTPAELDPEHMERLKRLKLF